MSEQRKMAEELHALGDDLEGKLTDLIALEGWDNADLAEAREGIAIFLDALDNYLNP